MYNSQLLRNIFLQASLRCHCRLVIERELHKKLSYKRPNSSLFFLNVRLLCGSRLGNEFLSSYKHKQYKQPKCFMTNSPYQSFLTKIESFQKEIFTCKLSRNRLIWVKFCQNHFAKILPIIVYVEKTYLKKSLFKISIFARKLYCVAKAKLSFITLD